MDTVYENIKKSSNTKQRKEKLKNYALNLESKDLPILFDSKQIDLLFSNIQDNKKEYYHYEVKKRNGEKRHIYQPSENLKAIQQWIVNNILIYCKISNNAHAFVKNKSIITNARQHLYKGNFWLLNMDVKNFFESIHKKSIINVFKELGYNNEVSKKLSEYCCINNKLVQGFCTSPILSNIIFKNIDEELLQLSKLEGLKYTRYADDISFSSTLINNIDIKYLKKEITYILNKSNFQINEEKTHYYNETQIKKITGIIIKDGKLQAPSKIKRFLDKEIYYCEKYGVNSHLEHENKLYLANYKGYLYGYANYISMIEKQVGEEFIKRLNNIDFS